MQRLAKQLGKRTYIAAAGLAAFTLLAGFAAVIPAPKASAVNCRVFSAESAFYEGGKVTSKTYTVPNAATSGCKDINVRNISARDENGKIIAGDHCATFTVQFFPTSGGTTYGTPKKVCSTGPNGTVVPIATNVINGTKYRVLHNVEELGRTHAYQIVD
jgi:hypothetical protein